MHALLRASGLARFYELGGGRGQPVGAVPQPQRRDWLEELEQRGSLGDAQVRVVLDVQGIHCAACVWVIEELWRRHAGALHLDLNPSLGQAVLTYDRTVLRLGDYLDAVERLGYRFAPASKRAAHEERGLLLRLGICVALAMNAMMFGVAEYLGMTPADGDVFALFRGISFVLAAAAVGIGGPVFFRSALHGLRQRVLHLDLPIALGIAVAFGSSVVGYVRGDGDSYFDTVTIFVALMLVGRYLQRRAVRRNRDYLLANDGAEHLRARRLRGGGVETVPVRDLVAGDRLLLAPGDLVPVRAQIDTPASLSLDWICGESAPRAFAAGSIVPAGAFHAGRTALAATVVASAADSGLLQLLASPPARRGDDVAGRGRFWSALNRVYAGLVLAVAAVAGVLWSWFAPERATDVVTAVLVVTCPCAIGLALPLAVELAIARLRRRGIFVRNVGLLEKACHVRVVVFDKTGTLTWGGLRVRTLRPPAAAQRDVLLTMAASSNHPVSRAIIDALGAGGFCFRDDLAVVETVGAGVSANGDGATYRLGSAPFVLGARAVHARGLCLFARDGHVEAVFASEEDLREGMVEDIAALRARGLDVQVLSGDRSDKVAAMARALGLPANCAHGDLTAAAKAAFVARIDRRDTMVIGDGLNDAPAFAAAFCAGTPALDRPVLPAHADFVIAGGGRGAVAAVLDVAQRFRCTVRASLVFAAAYNAVTLTLACSGAMSPLLCAILMPASSLVAIGSTAWRLRAVGTDRPRPAPRDAAVP